MIGTALSCLLGTVTYYDNYFNRFPHYIIQASYLVFESDHSLTKVRYDWFL